MSYSLSNLSREDILAAIGLQTKRTAADMVVPALGLFGVGMVVGAGLGLLFAPKAGAQTREAIGHGVGDVARRVKARLGREHDGLEDEALDFGDADELGGAENVIPTSSRPRNGSATRTSPSSSSSSGSGTSPSSTSTPTTTGPKA